MKAISIRNPWAAWIIHGFKSVETRSHAQFSRHAGELLAIHCSKVMAADYFSYAMCHAIETVAIESELSLTKFNSEHDFQADLGCVIGTALFTSHFWISDDLSDGDALCYASGTYGLQLNVRDVFERPIPAKGALYCWDWIPPADKSDGAEK